MENLNILFIFIFLDVCIFVESEMVNKNGWATQWITSDTKKSLLHARRALKWKEILEDIHLTMDGTSLKKIVWGTAVPLSFTALLRLSPLLSVSQFNPTGANLYTVYTKCIL